MHQLTVWVFWNPDRMREKIKDPDQLSWRCDPFGHDSKGRPYFVLDDNRLYRMTYIDQKPAPKKQKPKARPPPASSRRTSKRQKMANGNSSDVDEPEPDEHDALEADEGLDGAKWECLAVTHDDYVSFLDTIKKSKNPDDRDVYSSIMEDVMPELERADASKKRKDAQRMKELENLQRLSTAKRSSRIAGRAEKQREELEAQAAADKHRRDLEMAHAEKERQEKMDVDRESRMQTREQRLKDREMKRILHEEEMERLQRGESIDGDGTRMSERNRKAQIEQTQRDLDALDKEKEDDEWYFDCSGCGINGKGYEDNLDSIACDKCGVWQHSICHGIAPEVAARDDYVFTCKHCSKYPNGIKITVNKNDSESKKRKAEEEAPDEKPAKRGPGRPPKQPSQPLQPVQLANGAGASTGTGTGTSTGSASDSAGVGNSHGIPNGIHNTHAYAQVGSAFGTAPAAQHGFSAIAPAPASAVPSVANGLHSSPQQTQQPSFQTPSATQSSKQALVTPSHASGNGAVGATAPSSAASTRFIPSPQATSNAALAGRSPVKQDPSLSMSASSSFGAGPSSSFGLQQQAATENSSNTLATPAGKSTGAAPWPVLSPSVNTGPTATGAPVKKLTPEKGGEVVVPPPPVQYPPPPAVTAVPSPRKEGPA